MNTAERAIYTTITLGRIGKIVAERKVQRKSNGDSPNPVFLLMFKDYHKLLGVQESARRTEASGLADFGMVVTNYIFWCDGYLDSQPLGITESSEDFSYKGITHQERFDDVEQKAKELMVPPEKIDRILDLLTDFRRNVWTTHWSFFPSFSPLKTPYEEVRAYVSATTGATADILIRIMGTAASVPQERIEQAAAVGRQQANAFQMTDDLVDCVGDFGKRMNIFNALLLERPEELGSFYEASKNPQVLMRRRPFQIASVYAPKTIKDYMQRFDAMVQHLSPRQKTISRGLMATGTFMSFTPQNGTPFNPISLFLPKTKMTD